MAKRVKNSAAVRLGRLGGMALPKAERIERARKAANTRWMTTREIARAAAMARWAKKEPKK